MKNKTKLYAKALAEIIIKKKAEGPERSRRITVNFLKILQSKGLERKAGEILDLTEDLLLQKQGKRKITFETARKMTAGQKRILENFVKKGDVVKEKINPELIAGVKIIINESKQFDASMQTKLSRITGSRYAGQN
jgi:F0F1-type ATP synthase delta subunit